MKFTKLLITTIPSYEGQVTPEFLTLGLKNTKIEKGTFCWFCIQEFSDEEIRLFKEYWDRIKPLLNFDCIETAGYQLRWDGRPGSELYEFIFDSKTGHRITFGFYPTMKEYDVYYYNQKNQISHTQFLMGKLKNISTSLRIKEVLNDFYG